MSTVLGTRSSEYSSSIADARSTTEVGSKGHSKGRGRGRVGDAAAVTHTAEGRRHNKAMGNRQGRGREA